MNIELMERMTEKQKELLIYRLTGAFEYLREASGYTSEETDERINKMALDIIKELNNES